MEHLYERKQSIKLQMYQSKQCDNPGLQLILGMSVLCLFAVVVINGIFISKRDDSDMVTYQWKYKWFLLDGLYFIV
jgi:hypothetical protein